jgi:lipopolysaccharide transport system permease protein
MSSASSISAGRRWRELRPSPAWGGRVDPRELWEFREVVVFLAMRDLKLRYQQTLFGVAWALIQPLLGVAIFTAVFARVAGFDTEGVPYALFAYAGFVMWTYTSSSTDAAARSLIEDRAFVERIYFPRLLSPLASTLPGLLDLAISTAALAVFFAVFGVVPAATAALFPIWVIAAMMITLSVGVGLAALNVQYRDVRYALTFGLQLWFYATPVVYPSSLIDGPWRWLYAANPMVGLIDSVRWSLFGGTPPPISDLASLASALALLLLGFVYFHRVERRFADVI